jgi:hypothetical protein
MAAPQDVLVNFKGDATNFINALNQMMTHIQAFNQALGATSNAELTVAKSTDTASKSQDKMKASTVALGSVMGQLAMKALQWGKSMASSFAETGVETRKLQMIMGGTAEQMSALIGAMGAYKIPFDAMIVSYRTLAIQAVTNTKAFRDLGLSMRDANGQQKSGLQIIMDAADAYVRLADETQRTAAFGVLMGRRYKELAPLLSQGSEGIKALMKNAKNLGIVLDEEGVKKATQFTMAQTQLHQAIQGLTFSIMTQLVPSLTKVVAGFTNAVVALKNWMNKNPEAIKFIGHLVGAFLALYAVVKTVSAIQAIFTASMAIGQAVTSAIGFLKLLVGTYRALGVAAAFSAAAEASSLAMTGVGLIVVGGAVAGVSVLIDKMMSKLTKIKTDIPNFGTADTTGTDSYMPSTGGATGKSKAEIAHDAAVERAKKHLDSVKKFWDAQVEAAKSALDVAKEGAKKYDDIVKTIAEGIQKSAEAPSLIEESFAKYLGPQNLVKAFQKKVDDAREFLGALTRLKDLNLSPDILMQLAAAGPQQGLEAARVLLSDTSTIGSLNALQAQLTTLATNTSVMVGGYVAPESQAASGSIAGLTTALANAEAGRTTAVDAAQAAYDKADSAKVTVIANTNASPHLIGKEVAYAITTGSYKNKKVPFGVS